MSSNARASSRPVESDRDRTIRTKNADACPVVQTFDVVGTTWRIQVLYALEDSERRFNDLKRATEGRSKTLSEALDVLQEHDLVVRRMERDAPVAVYYSLTEKGRAFVDSLDGLEQWAIEWMETVEDPDAKRPRAD